ncbi:MULTISPECIES: cell division protein FtsQ/DivIB [unclassified Paenibacillus]|uniref:cell division protein FtsQ/DivIB n=1 Tax=unclassified Paenibacillus TaxID=185978 RepID=UPI001C11CD94|nr:MULTISPECIES: FtsQ-type POTRA domain-containing protein [unclassified Paenibacillus]MBU5440525.1 FtsQ-type POTRA domain-containing protein [Paenibacillus sp. MSJ-34]CAH0119552.1 Cell division protein DivIB [Paenibacillus sp. CECT 9249]
MQKSMPVLKEKKVKPRGNRKLLFILLLLFIILLAVLFFRSSISKISEVRFAGNRYVSNEELWKTSGVKIGDQYFGTSKGTIRERLLAIPSIEDVKVDKHFPGVIDVQVKEFATVAYELSQTDGHLSAILANGTNVSLTDKDVIVEKPILTQWKADDPNKALLSKELALIPNELLADISEIIPYPSQSYQDRIKIYTRSQFEVVTAISLLQDKVRYLSGIIETQQPGIITMLAADSYIPYEGAADGAEQEKETTQ